MSFQKAIFISFGLGTALALAGCGAKDTQPQGAGGGGGAGPGSGGAPMGGAPMGGAPMGGTTGAAGMTGGAGMMTGGPGTTCADTNLAGYVKDAAPVSFTTDILPMFGLSCVTSDCHNSADGPMKVRAGLELGHKCSYDMNAKWKCTFPPAPLDPNDLGAMAAPDDPATAMAVYTSLMAPATTTNKTMPRVKPFDPAHSFLMLKLADKQNAAGLTCMNQDPSHGTGAPCGDSMPLNGDKWCMGSPRLKFDTIAQWIANGAPMN